MKKKRIHTIGAARLKSVTARPDLPKINSPRWVEAILIPFHRPFSFLPVTISSFARTRACQILRNGEIIITARYLSFVKMSLLNETVLFHTNLKKRKICLPAYIKSWTMTEQIYFPKFERNNDVRSANFFVAGVFFFCSGIVSVMFSVSRKMPPFRKLSIALYHISVDFASFTVSFHILA